MASGFLRMQADAADAVPFHSLFTTVPRVLCTRPCYAAARTPRGCAL